MKSDSARLDAIARAHLEDPRDASHRMHRMHRMHRYEAPVEFAEFLQWFWIPVWSVPPGQEAPQKVLQYPNSLIVVAQDYARFYGVVSGLSTTTLTGDGWAVGVACAPSAGHLLAGALRPYLPVDDEGELVNRLVAFVESRTDVTRVAQVCAEFGLSERALQRLVHRRIGLTPKWLIQRRRLQEAAERLRTDGTSLGEMAAVLGYADQPHFSRDFSAVTGMTPGEFAALHARP